MHYELSQVLKDESLLCQVQSGSSIKSAEKFIVRKRNHLLENSLLELST